jgi:intraflagellar transport protein 140
MIRMIDKEITDSPSRTYEEDVEEAMKQCLLLLEEPDLDTGVRSGDIYGFMIEHYASAADFQKVRVWCGFSERVELCDAGFIISKQINSSQLINSIYIVLVFTKNYPQQAYHLVQELKQRLPNASLAYYVNNTVLEQIKRSVGLDEETLATTDTPGIEEEIEEEIPEDFGF